MSYTNSPLVAYTKLSPNHSGQRTHGIDRITPHCVVGQLSCETICDCFRSTSVQASCNYGIGTDGRVSLCVEEKNRSWCTSSSANDQRAITIECASDKVDPYTMNNKVYATLINLCADICKRNGKKKLLWFGDKTKSLNYEPKSDEMVLTVHRWYANKSCPGDWLYARMGDLAAKVNAILGSSSVIVEETKETGLQASSLKGLSEAKVVEKVGSLFTTNQKVSGVLACVSLAQFILESGYAQTDLAQNANNCFGMKKSLSGNTWANSTWDGKSIYTKKTQEDDGKGNLYYITADFRKYPCVEDSIADHSAYLLGAKNGSALRYAGLAGCTDYKEAITIIKNGGYATDTSYIQKICSIIERWNLTQYNADESTPAPTVTPTQTVTSFPEVPFTVNVLIDDLNYRASGSNNAAICGQTGKGIFTITEVKNAWGKLKSGAGWIYLGNPSYCTVQSHVATATTQTFKPYQVRVKVSDLKIRKGAGIDNAFTGKYTGKGVFTIVEEKKGKVNKDGTIGTWGKLKSGAGWICLAFSSYTDKV